MAPSLVPVLAVSHGAVLGPIAPLKEPLKALTGIPLPVLLLVQLLIFFDFLSEENMVEN